MRIPKVLLLLALAAPAAGGCAGPEEGAGTVRGTDLIAYTGGGGIYTVPAHGGQEELLPGTEAFSNPSWSPDGKKLAAVNLEVCCGVVLMNPDGTGQRKLPFNTSSGIFWAPDGRRVAYFNEGDLKLHVARLDGSDDRVLVQGNMASWSPEGDRIAFQWRGSSDYLQIHVAKADGTGKRELTSGGGEGEGDYSAAWSPAGGLIAFVSDRAGQRDIYVMDEEGGGLRNLTDSPESEYDPTWSPDGKHVAFVRGDVDQSAIYVLTLETGEERRVTRPAFLFAPAWRPATGG